MKPERIVHLGLGAFFRAHQAYYTQKATDSAQWGIVAYTGRSSEQSDLMNAQGCSYTLITRGTVADSFETIDSVVRTAPGTDLEDLKQTLANPDVAIVNLTITEAGYHVNDLQLNNSALGRLVLALEHRFVETGLPVALVSCDNLPANGQVLRSVLEELGAQLGAGFRGYLKTLSYVTTSVDRITPKTQPEDVSLAQTASGTLDAIPVVTEQFSDWVLSGEFPLGRPNWESAGARFVADIEPFENRKLWLLNGAHSLMSFMGQQRGHLTVSEAIEDPEIRASVDIFWDEACRHLDPQTLALTEYRQALLERFSNPRIGYLLTQIAQEGLSKLIVRIVPVALKELKAGRFPQGCADAIASWLWLVQSGREIKDARIAEIEKANGPAGLLALISELSAESEFIQKVLDRAVQLETQLVER
jgi:fructuronate reductase